MFEKILLPLDGSALAERSIPHAIEFARIFKSKILLLRVLEPVISEECSQPAEPLQWQLLKAKTDLYMHDVANQIRQALNLPQLEDETDGTDRVTVNILEGKIAENIVDFAQKEAIDLLVISSHGSGGLSRWNLNSVVSKVVNLIYTPVLIIRGYQVESVETTHLRYERILIPIDCSRRSEYSLNAAIAFAQNSQSHLILTSVIKPPDIPTIEPFNQELQHLSDQFLELTHKALNYYLNELSQRTAVDNEIRIIEHPSILQAILQLAKDENVDLIISCAHGHTGDTSWPFGTIARSLIEYCTKPVLVIQDLPRSQVTPSEAAQAAERTRSRE
ncbi:MAG: universal stress protein [Anaerolineaceae bacterium]